jgi:hypothetical protein
LCGSAWAQIALQDGNFTTAMALAAGAPGASISYTFTVILGAIVLVVSLFDRNGEVNLSPTSLLWGPQIIGLAVRQNNDGAISAAARHGTRRLRTTHAADVWRPLVLQRRPFLEIKSPICFTSSLVGAVLDFRSWRKEIWRSGILISTAAVAGNYGARWQIENQAQFRWMNLKWVCSPVTIRLLFGPGISWADHPKANWPVI